VHKVDNGANGDGDGDGEGECIAVFRLTGGLVFYTAEFVAQALRQLVASNNANANDDGDYDDGDGGSASSSPSPLLLVSSSASSSALVAAPLRSYRVRALVLDFAAVDAVDIHALRHLEQAVRSVYVSFVLYSRSASPGTSGKECLCFF
jgi:anti-anti-sigma regulatory factor